MTYCVGMRLNRGLIFMSDTRTNAGVDNISVFKKMFKFRVPGERFITLMTAGNLATTQAVISLLEEETKKRSERRPSILEAPTMYQVANLVGQTLRQVISEASGNGQAGEAAFGASVIVGGQIGEGVPHIYLVYPEGNFVETTDDTPYFQIGETKYGKPILVRAYDPDMSFEEATKLLLVSFDSTIKANISVDLPLDLITYEDNSFAPLHERRIEKDDADYAAISNSWGDALRTAFDSIPNPTLG